MAAVELPVESGLADLQEGPAGSDTATAEGLTDGADSSVADAGAEASLDSTEAGTEPVVGAAVASGDYPGPEGIDESSSVAPAPAADAIDLTTVRLFGEGDSGIDDGPPTELFDTVADQGSSPLGEPDAAADAAMRAFFERDLDEADDAKGSRFGRRR